MAESSDDVPKIAHLEPGLHEYQIDLEAEHRREILGRPGKIDLTVFESHGRMARLADAIAYAEATGLPVDPSPVRRYRQRDGISLNLDQQLTGDLGLFARMGDAGGNVEIYEYTEIDRTVSAGLSLSGGKWRRPTDTLGLATVVNAISKARQHYLAAGGLGILIGDGRLPHPGDEHIWRPTMTSPPRRPCTSHSTINASTIRHITATGARSPFLHCGCTSSSEQADRGEPTRTPPLEWQFRKVL
ncbi:MAG: carbohydrate porin [Steroidobacteraceae bacterium]